jgi:hypothetical protein
LGRDFEVTKELTIFMIDLMIRRIRKEKLDVRAEFRNRLNELYPKVSSKEFLSISEYSPGVFYWFDFDPRVTAWTSEPPNQAIEDLETMREKIQNLTQEDMFDKVYQLKGLNDYN